MCRGMRKPCELKILRYADRINDLDGYLAVFPGAKVSDKIGETYFNAILLNCIPNRWSNQAYMQGLYCEYNNLKVAVNMFEGMETYEYIY